MVRLILSLALLACLFAPGARAQATADQLNKLSLEALTAPPSRGSGGYAPVHHSYAPRPAWHARSHYAAAPRRRWAPRRSYAATRWSHPVPQRHFVAHWTRAPRPAPKPRRVISPYTPKFYRHR